MDGHSLFGEMTVQRDMENGQSYYVFMNTGRDISRYMPVATMVKTEISGSALIRAIPLYSMETEVR